MHCPKFGYLQQVMGRAYTDIDFAAYSKQTKDIRVLLAAMGYRENREVFIVSEGERAIYDKPEIDMHIDVFYEKLNFCHVIRWTGRLEVDSPSIPLAEMLLEKMQIVQINEKDIIDTIMLLLEHPLGDIDKETINIKRVSRVVCRGLGFVAHYYHEPEQGAPAGPGLRTAYPGAEGKNQLPGRVPPWPG